jgi:hypothetical protein
VFLKNRWNKNEKYLFNPLFENSQMPNVIPFAGWRRWPLALIYQFVQKKVHTYKINLHSTSRIRDSNPGA